MRERHRRRGDGANANGDLELALRDLASAVELPAAMDVAGSVRRRLEADGAVSVRRAAWRDALRPQLAFRRSFALALLAVLVVAGVTLAVGLGLRGLHIVFVDELPPVPSPVASAPRGEALRIGTRVGPDDARTRAGFPVVVPSAPGFDRPDEVYLLERDPSNVVSFVYEPRADVPPAGRTDVGALLMQFRGSIDEDYMKALLRGGVSVTRVEVNGELGFWIEGEHVLRYIGPDQERRDEPSRIVDKVLVWQRGDLLLRLETSGTRDDALRVAESLR